MPGWYYEALGRAVWKGGLWYVRRHRAPVRNRRARVAKRIGVGALAAVGIAGAVLVAQRRQCRAG